jgi:molecular chaperone GrpE
MPDTPNEKPAPSKAEKLLDFVELFRVQTEELARKQEQSEKKAAEYFEKLQRLQADMENLQKITKRQVETVTRQASEALLVKLLPILDALQQAAKVAQNGNSLPPEEISVGLNLLFMQLLEVLKSEGLEEIPAMGEVLNPERHEVVSSVDRSDVPENTVVEEVRKGYLLGGRVIRTSLVVVSKPKPLKNQEMDKGEPSSSP